MEWVIAAIVVAAIGLAALAATGALGELRPEPIRDTYRQPLPHRPLAAQDLDNVRFGVTVRGYAMRQVDDLLDRLANELAQRDQEIAVLRAGSAPSPYGTPDLGGAGGDTGEPVVDDPWAEYDLDGGQGVPERGAWYSGDGRADDDDTPERPESFPQYPQAEAEPGEPAQGEAEAETVETGNAETGNAETGNADSGTSSSDHQEDR
ncbi:DivIVA domain-containing protein [Microlunatus sp. Y2014]|uniref:DivIVA domain-containing protein n=1 Tax=Microlunatus sp. Y2014 TaxID=3418488 RepID=UPI003DA71265